MEHPFGVRKGAWTEEEDLLLRKCIQKYGEGKWHQVPLRAGLRRCRKSCRLRWLNYLRPNIKRGEFTPDEVDLIIKLHKLLGNRWSLIAGRLPGRTANDIKNYWNTRLNKNHVYEGEVGKPIVKTGKIKAIKPQPWAFPKNHPLLRRLSASTSKETTTTTITNTTATTTTQSRELLGMESPTLPPEDPWLLWEDVLVRKEEEKGTSCSINASREELIKSLLIDDVETTTKGGETSSKEGKGDWDDFSWIEDIVPMTKEGGEILGDDGKNDWNELFFDYNLWDTL